MEDFVMPEAARYADTAQEMSGAPAAPGMAPYPLYGVPSLRQAEDAVPLWKKPVFCYAAGAIAGFGLGYAFFGWFKPKFIKKNPGKKRRTTRKPKALAEASEE